MDGLESLGTPCKDKVHINYLERRTVFPIACCSAEALTMSSIRVSHCRLQFPSPMHLNWNRTCVLN